LDTMAALVVALVWTVILGLRCVVGTIPAARAQAA
jgi:hypothetical protein